LAIVVGAGSGIGAYVAVSNSNKKVELNTTLPSITPTSTPELTPTKIINVETSQTIAPTENYSYSDKIFGLKLTLKPGWSAQNITLFNDNRSLSALTDKAAHIEVRHNDGTLYIFKATDLTGSEFSRVYSEAMIPSAEEAYTKTIVGQKEAFRVEGWGVTRGDQINSTFNFNSLVYSYKNSMSYGTDATVNINGKNYIVFYLSNIDVTTKLGFDDFRIPYEAQFSTVDGIVSSITSL
jgi:hypothetical protein